jgi:carboxyl-terminal processing protease
MPYKSDRFILATVSACGRRRARTRFAAPARQFARAIFQWQGAVMLAAALLAAPLAAADDAAPTLTPAARKLLQVMESIKARYADRVSEEKLVSDAIEAMVKNLDRHSAYLDTQAFREVRRENRGRFGGLGLEVGIENGAVRVTQTFDDTPAARAGIRPGDLILKVDDAEVRGMSLEQVIQRARGEAGSEVSLVVVPKDQAEARMLRLTRALVRSRTVRASVLEPGYAYLQISQFHEGTPEELVAGLQRTLAQPEVRGIVLDLRDNNGGLLRAAVAVSAGFLPPDTLVAYTESPSAESRMRLHARAEHYLRGNADDPLKRLPEAARTLPMVVLINGGSASAAEIVAGALQDHKRARLVGHRTYGKGSVQTIIPLSDDSAIKLTTGYYFTPSGRMIHGKGLTPDLLVDQLATQDGAVRAVAVGRQGGDLPIEAVPLTCAAVSVDASEAARAGPDTRDCQLERAMQLLRSVIALARN